MKKVLLGLLITAFVLIGGICLYNYSQLQVVINDVIKNDTRNIGISVKVYYVDYINTSEIVYDLKSVSPTNSSADVFRVFLQFSDKLKGKTYKKIIFAYKGNYKFMIKDKR